MCVCVCARMEYGVGDDDRYRFRISRCIGSGQLVQRRETWKVYEVCRFQLINCKIMYLILQFILYIETFVVHRMYQ